MAIDVGPFVNILFFVGIAIVFAILALAFNLQWGYTGLFNAGIAGFFMIGAYICAIAITGPAPPIIISGIPVYPGHLGGFSLPFIIGVVLAMLGAGLVAALVAIPTLRLRADYLAIATLAFAEIARVIAINLESVTGGTIGIILIPRPIEFDPPDPFLNSVSMVAISGTILIALFIALRFMVESPWGRVKRAIREDEEATMALGKNTFGHKLEAFAIGGAIMGLAGALFAVTLGYVEPTISFAPAVTFTVWVMVIVGGAGNNWGAVLGAFVIYGLEFLSVQFKDFAPEAIGDLIFYIRPMIIGVLLILLILFRPKGILPERKRVAR